MRLFLYEHLTAGGDLDLPDSLSPSLLAEGLAMLHAVGEDLGCLPDVELRLLADSRLDARLFPGKPVFVSSDAQREQVFSQAVRWSDGVILIAPETNGVLLRFARQVEELGGKLLSPSPAFIELTSNKQRTAECLAAANVPTPVGRLWRLGEPLPIALPAVLKPVNGCGSQDIRLITSVDQSPSDGGPRRLETHHPGLAASVALLCGKKGSHVTLPACTQRLSNDGHFRYLGGATPLPEPLDERACQLAKRALDGLTPHATPLGYVGVDLVLGDDAHGSQDVVIEVNPRLTTSYVGLRTACRGNLGELMLRKALGEEVTVDFRCERIEFEACGKVRMSGASSALTGDHSR